MQQRFLLQFLLLAQHVSGTTMPIIRSSRVLYSGCCLWYFALWFSSCWSGVELRVMCPVCRMLQSTMHGQQNVTFNLLSYYVPFTRRTATAPSHRFCILKEKRRPLGGHQGGLVLARQCPGSPGACHPEDTGLPMLPIS